MLTLFGEALRRHATGLRSPAALVAADREISYAELDLRVRACAAWLLAEGCAPREIVGVTLADEVPHLVVCLALLTLGVPQAALPTFETQAVRRRLAERLALTRVVVADAADAIPGIVASRFDVGAPAGAPGDVTPLNADPEAIAIFHASSGTTGEPKLFAMSQALMATRQSRRNFQEGERHLMLTKVENYPAKAARLGAIWRGCTAVLSPGPAPSTLEVASACERHAVTRIDVGVMHLANFLEGEIEALPAGVNVFTGGSRVPMRMREAFRARAAARLHVEYGARELGAVASTFPVDRDPAQETVGPGVPECEIEIVDADGRKLAPGEVGEVRCRGIRAVSGYHDDAAATARHFRDGWFHPGDLGWFTPNGSLCLAGRVDDVMNLNGIKITPLEIERVLEEEPDVRAAAAFALPSGVHGQVPVVAVEWAGSAKPDPAALQARARAKLGVRAPRKVFVVDALPRNPAGKVAKGELVRWAESSGAARSAGKP